MIVVRGLLSHRDQWLNIDLIAKRTQHLDIECGIMNSMHMRFSLWKDRI